MVLENPLDSKEINAWCEELTLMLGKMEGKGEEDGRGWDG